MESSITAAKIKPGDAGLIVERNMMLLP